MLTRMQIFILAGLGLLLTAIVLIVVTQQRENEIAIYQFNAQKNLLSNASQALSDHILKQRRDLQSFVSQNYPLLIQLRRNPRNRLAYAQLQKRLGVIFPQYSNFTIIDERGSPIWLDVESRIGLMCRNEITRFSREVARSGFKAKSQILMHKNISEHHYDLMTLLQLAPGINNIFFVSLNSEGLADILKAQQMPGHSLMLVKKGDTALIELTAKGTSGKINRNIRLSNDELIQLQTFEDVKGTDWRVVDLQDESVVDIYREQLWQKVSSIALMVFIAGLFLIIFLIRHSTKRRLSANNSV